jgi:hypothetical protein
MRRMPQFDDANVASVAMKPLDLFPPMFIGEPHQRLQLLPGLRRQLPGTILVGIHGEDHQGRQCNVRVEVQAGLHIVVHVFPPRRRLAAADNRNLPTCRCYFWRFLEFSCEMEGFKCWREACRHRSNIA